MKRVISILLLAAAALAGIALLIYGPLIAAPQESEELAAPAMTPVVFVSDVPTVVAFVSTLPNQSIRSPRLQWYDPTKARWRTIARLRDDGKFGDQTADDRTFTLQLQFLETGGFGRISLLRKAGWRLKATGQSPIRLRLAAGKKGQWGRVVSPPSPLMLGAWGTFENANIGYAVGVPPAFRTAHSTSQFYGQETDEVEIFAPSDASADIGIRITAQTPRSPLNSASDLELDLTSARLVSQQLVQVAGADALRSELVTPAGRVVEYDMLHGGRLINLAGGFSDVQGQSLVDGIVSTLSLD